MAGVIRDRPPLLKGTDCSRAWSECIRSRLRTASHTDTLSTCSPAGLDTSRNYIILGELSSTTDSRASLATAVTRSFYTSLYCMFITRLPILTCATLPRFIFHYIQHAMRQYATEFVTRRRLNCRIVQQLFAIAPYRYQCSLPKPFPTAAPEALRVLQRQRRSPARPGDIGRSQGQVWHYNNDAAATISTRCGSTCNALPPSAAL